MANSQLSWLASGQLSGQWPAQLIKQSSLNYWWLGIRREISHFWLRFNWRSEHWTFWVIKASKGLKSHAFFFFFFFFIKPKYEKWSHESHEGCNMKCLGLCPMVNFQRWMHERKVQLPHSIDLISLGQERWWILKYFWFFLPRWNITTGRFKNRKSIWFTAVRNP